VEAGTSSVAITGPALKIFAGLRGTALLAIESAIPFLRMKTVTIRMRRQLQHFAGV
jgi:hypothetical protein